MDFTRLSKGLSVVLLLGYLIPQLLPWTTSYLALIPAKTIPFIWNIITAGYVEKSIIALTVSISSLLISGKLLEPIWSPREFLKFIVFVNACTLGGVYITAVISYYITGRESFLYTPLSGFHGVISGFLVGVKQAVPNQEIMTLGGFHMRAKWLPSLFVLMSITLSFFTSETLPYLPFVHFGTYSAWLYARYLYRDPETDLFGCPAEEFAFSTFFPPFMRSIVDALSTCCHMLWCKRQAMRKEDDDALKSTSLSSFDGAEASRWRSILNLFFFLDISNISFYLKASTLVNSPKEQETSYNPPLNDWVCSVLHHWRVLLAKSFKTCLKHLFLEEKKILRISSSDWFTARCHFYSWFTEEFSQFLNINKE